LVLFISCLLFSPLLHLFANGPALTILVFWIGYFDFQSFWLASIVIKVNKETDEMKIRQKLKMVEKFEKNNVERSRPKNVPGGHEEEVMEAIYPTDHFYIETLRRITKDQIAI
jgi:hypothetical protein